MNLSPGAIKIRCHNCKLPFYRELRWVKYNIKINNNNYCSKNCGFDIRKTGKIFKCENVLCSKKFYRAKNNISPHNYCSQSCGATVNNKKFPKRLISEEDRYNVCQQCKLRFFTNWKKKKLCSPKCYSLLRKDRKKYTEEELLKIIKLSFKKLGRVPAKREMKDILGVCTNTFGSWNKAIEASGLVPNRSHDNRMYKRSMAKAADGHICDSISEAIIDNWLTEHRITHEKGVSYPKTNHKADWAIKNGKVLVEYFGLTKDSPRYDRDTRRKKNICRRNNIKLIAIYPEDIYPRPNLGNKLLTN